MKNTGGCFDKLKMTWLVLIILGLAGCSSMPKASDLAATPETVPVQREAAVVARINGAVLDRDALIRQYDLYFILSGDSKQGVSLEAFRSRYLLELLLLQEVKGSDIRLGGGEVDGARREYLEETGLSEAGLSDKLAQAGLDLTDADRFFRNNLLIDQWSRIEFSNLALSDEDALGYYNENPDLFVQDTDNEDAGLIPFENVKDVIRETLTTSRIQSALFSHAMQLRETADIELYDIEGGTASSSPTAQDASTAEVPETQTPTSDGPFPTFRETGTEPCTDESGLPVVLLFSADSCSHCQWVGGVFDLVVQQYVERGLVAAHHYNVETGDDLLTEAVETRIPEAHLSIGRGGDPDGLLPYFNFGCSYDRIGTGYEAQDDLAAEAEEMCQVIEALLY